MTPEECVTKVIDAYENARAPLWRHPKLQRGECRNVASVMEDLIAVYLVKRLPSIDRVFINQTLIAPGQPRFKPDLVIGQLW
jgi:hypothetical protein